ncbi:hypothetical protein [Bergeyella zoohelcum]|uniref:Uncharacterized protein n=1 Tax=Bergeyella zoohelcum ATCC 43767 TaxID=883096 RepID=K1MKU7_9FLAO|nr:hypothetical protein [Bergeyella zoohelcum]EKB56599.1 hypothetical protein HMPREF9699_01328 [Bergeyella zoohelcum ATCC 43767]SUV48493.1 Uncharacterised protein [Bergeyella zoohelcum]
MAKRVNFPKPLFLNSRVIDIFRERFLVNVRFNTFSGIYVYCSKNIKEKSIPYKVGEFNGICVSDSWKEEKNDFSIFIISDEDYDNALNGNYSEDVLFFINRVNKRQSLADEKNKKISADVMIIKETDFLQYYSDRKRFIQKYFKAEYQDNLYEEMLKKPQNELF